MQVETIKSASEDSLSYSNNDEDVHNEIEISIDSIENIIRNESFLIKIVIEHEDLLLGESDTIKINSSYKNLIKVYPIDFKISLSYIPNNTSSIAPLVSTPILIKIFEILGDNGSSKPNIESKDNETANERSTSELESSRKLYGMCNIDMLPIILGEITFSEKLLVQSPSYTWDQNIVSWENLSRISITVQQDEIKILEDIDFNFLSITIESMYNLPDNFTNSMNYKCGTILYPHKNVKESCIIFDDGTWTNISNVEKMKSWRSLQDVQSRARLSKYKIDSDFNNIKNDFKSLNLKTIIEPKNKRIKWNVMNRSFLDKKNIDRLKDRLKKYKYWPFEVIVKENVDPSETKRESTEEVIYQFYADISQLIFPGQKKVRVLSQIHMQSLAEMKEKTGLEISIFSNKSLEDCELQSDEIPSTSDCSVYGENGKPVYILVEFELYKTLFPARILEDFTKATEILKNKPKPNKPIYLYTPDLVHDQYIKCIKQLVDVLEESYRDDLTRFKQYLHETGKYLSMQSTLKNKIINLLDQKFPLNSADCFSTKNQDFIVSCYSYLVEQMHIALNTKLDVRFGDEYIDPENPDELWIRAEEAYEYKHYDKANKLLIKIISNDRSNASSWVKYGIYLLKISNNDEAIECCREAIRLNSRHKIALLMYGILLAMNENYSEAEIFIKAVTLFYPRFSEGWVILHLLYVKTEYYPGIDITLQLAEKCLKDRIPDKDTMEILEKEPIAWSTNLCSENRIFILTAVLLLKLNLYNFAGLALTQELSLRQKSVEFLYFFSVNAYLNRNYEIALDYLNQAETIIGTDYSIAALLGHVFYEFGDMNETIKYYEIVDKLYERPENIHLVHLRMGFYFISNRQYERARNIFSRACKQASTCKIWLGFGISNYHLEYYEECEAALIEANRIDDEDPEVWAYLCLLSISLHRYDEFTQCYRQTVKNNLKNDELWRLITRTMDTFNYTTPFVFDDPSKKCTCTAMSWAKQ
ncbi:PREDICTED: tetratricopeptide repeat protein 18 [Ceratosolen solmsi marchali]|uniref:Tetratricopeptide repeat protein 18 n=1 Tax=Ceratosolen solmsi marchali TaxID=326594 RepID=A0AAJ6YLU6_9HYME|nr:PREDICTED: tetratricopeptide repeat protein 18 [Ceratosolen solmsi marchali]